MGNASSDTLNLTLIDDKDEAYRLLKEAENRDFYMEECRDDPANDTARRGLSYSVQRITPEEKQYYQAHLDEALKRLPLRLTRDLGEVSIVPLMPSADGGMPHTRPKSLLCFSNLKQLISDNTLTHELWHVHQRIFQDAWKNIFNDIHDGEYVDLADVLTELSFQDQLFGYEVKERFYEVGSFSGIKVLEDYFKLRKIHELFSTTPK